MNTLRFYLFAARWLWKNRSWESSRQKYKALDLAWKSHQLERDAKRNKPGA